MKDHIEEITLKVVMLEDGDDWSSWILENPKITAHGKSKEESLILLKRELNKVIRQYGK